MKVMATIQRKQQSIGEDAESFLARKPDRVVIVRLEKCETNKDDGESETKGGAK